MQLFQRKSLLFLFAAITVILLAHGTTTYASAQAYQFSSTGAAQTWTVPSGVTRISVTAFGAQGGADVYQGGYGGEAYGELSVTPGDVLYIYIGKAGQGGSGLVNAQGGWNGGGNAGPGGWSGAGGGASDVRINGQALTDRILVAGGGGGGGQYSAGYPGGGNGPLTNVPGQGASHPNDGGGGGGGYLGGNYSSGDNGGGGGSSYIGGVLAPSGTLSGVRAGDGLITITVISTIALAAAVDYSTTELTNSNVIATLAPNQDVTVTNNGGSLSYTFTENGSFTFEFEDTAGNTGTATATVSNIDKTAPATSDDAPTGWVEPDVTVHLTAADSQSGIAATYYTIDGGQAQSGSSLVISTQGIHTISYWSVDTAGNAEMAHSKDVHVVLADFNGDGQVHIDDTVSWIFTGTFAQRDINQDNVFDVTDIRIMLGAIRPIG